MKSLAIALLSIPQTKNRLSMCPTILLRWVHTMLLDTTAVTRVGRPEQLLTTTHVHQIISPGQLSVEDLQQQGLQYPNMMMPTHQYHDPYNTSPVPHVPIPLSHSPPPPSPELYDPLSPPVSGSDTSADGLYNSSGNNSPSSSRANSLVHRHTRYNPTPSPTSSSGRRSRGRSQDSDEDEMGPYQENLAHSRKEATRKQRIEAEQRRRDELRDGYAKLKDVLPVSNQKSSKVSLLERGKFLLIDRSRWRAFWSLLSSDQPHHSSRSCEPWAADSTCGVGVGDA